MIEILLFIILLFLLIGFLFIALIIIDLLRIFSNIPNKFYSPQKTDKNLPSKIK